MLIDFDENLNNISSIEVIVEEGYSPGKRYGHSMVYFKNILYLFGGFNEKKEILNDFWSLNFEKTPFNWTRINPLGKIPMARIYHSMNLFKYYHNEEIIVIFGGRDSEGKSLSDIFGIKRNKNYWEFCYFSSKESSLKLLKYTPLVARKTHQNFNKKSIEPPKCIHHRSVFIGPFLFVTGGEKQSENEFDLNVFSMISMKWFQLAKVNLYRHSIFEYLNIKNAEEYDIFLYAYGGLNSESDKFSDDFIKYDVIELFSGIEILNNELDEYVNNYVNFMKDKK